MVEWSDFFPEAAAMVLALDPTRLIMNQKNGYKDMADAMYSRVAAIVAYGKRKDTDKPFVICEYSHAAGNSCGNFKDYWDTDNEWNKESIYEINYDQTKSERDWGTGQSVGGMVIPTLISPNSYGDDTWSNNDGWGFLPVRFDVRDELLKDDGRLEGTVWDLTDATYTMRSDDTHLWLQKYRPYNKNYENGTSSPNLNYGNNYRMYRYSEALLYAAEFALRTGDAGAAKTYVDPVRQRAGIATAAAYTLDDILTERHKEFVGEGKRYFDPVRAELITDQPVSNDNKASTRLVPTQSDALSGVSYGRTKAWTAQKKYIPIAQAELDSDPALKQNSDYFN
jgi:hypothetical protein